MFTTRLLQVTGRTATGVAAALALGAEALLRGGVTAAHDPEALRVGQAEVREAPVPQAVVRSCRSALLGQLASATDDVERVAQAMREVRCTHRVASVEDDVEKR